MNYFTSSDVNLAYEVDGPTDAPTIILINSIGTNLHMWDAQVSPLSQRLRVVRYDCRGHGASGVSTGPYTLEGLGLDLLALLDTLQVQQAHLCGLSLGGIIALWFAMAYPQRVGRAVFANTAARIGTTESWNTRIEAVKAGGMSAIRDTVLARFLSANFRQQYPETARKISDMIETTNPNGYISTCEALREADLRTRVSKIRVPSLIIGSALDESTPPSQAHELHALIPDSQLVIFDDVAHLSNVERPIEFSNHILSFLNESFARPPL